MTPALYFGPHRGRVGVLLSGYHIAQTNLDGVEFQFCGGHIKQPFHREHRHGYAYAAIHADGCLVRRDCTGLESKSRDFVWTRHRRGGVLGLDGALNLASAIQQAKQEVGCDAGGNLNAQADAILAEIGDA